MIIIIDNYGRSRLGFHLESFSLFLIAVSAIPVLGSNPGVTREAKLLAPR